MKPVTIVEEEPPGSGSAAHASVTPAAWLSPHANSTPNLGIVRAQRPAFIISKQSSEFMHTFYPDVTASEWNDWRWQNRHRVRSMADLARMVELSEEEQAAINRHTGPLPVGITPYYASLISTDDPNQGIRRCVVPTLGEFEISRGEADDPLGEDAHSPVPGLVHRYPDRVLLLVTNFCSVYCRYCTRARMVGAGGERSIKKADIELALAYIEHNPTIRDVLISGGDPLSLDDDRLEFILSRLRRIKHVEFVRIGSKQPIVMPMRVTRPLCRILKRYHPLWMSLHVTHPDELTPEVAEACGRLADAGIPLGSQTVLLKGVNDSLETMRKLVHGLLKIRVRPYYLYQCDPISGSAHFRTPVSTGVELIRGLRGYTSGYSVPTFVIDAPNGGGKIPVAPEYTAGYEGRDLLLKSYDGRTYRYPDPGAPSSLNGGARHGS
jgi:lysine 2,3-aminomutase